MSERTSVTRAGMDRETSTQGLVALRAYPSPEAGDVALALLNASGVRGLALGQPDGSTVVAVHARDEAAAERVLGAATARER